MTEFLHHIVENREYIQRDMNLFHAYQSIASNNLTATTETSTKIIETIRQVEYTTGTSYTVTGTNINIPATPHQGATYTIMTQGAPFQFSETHLGPGVAKETWIDRTTEQKSTTNSISVFTQ